MSIKSFLADTASAMTTAVTFTLENYVVVSYQLKLCLQSDKDAYLYL